MSEAVSIDEWLHKGGVALAAFFQYDVGCFLRATGPSPVRKDEGGHFPSDTGATSTNRAFLAALELLFFLVEEERFKPGTDHDEDEDDDDSDRWASLGGLLQDIIARMVEAYYTNELSILQTHSENGRNDFTDSHLLLAKSCMLGRFLVGVLDLANGDPRGDDIPVLAKELEDRLEELGGASLSSVGRPHPLVTLHAVRAVETARHMTGSAGDRSRVRDALEAKLRQSARDDVLHQLGLHLAEDAEFDPAALLGAVTLLHRFAGMSSRRLVIK